MHTNMSHGRQDCTRCAWNLSQKLARNRAPEVILHKRMGLDIVLLYSSMRAPVTMVRLGMKKLHA